MYFLERLFWQIHFRKISFQVMSPHHSDQNSMSPVYLIIGYSLAWSWSWSWSFIVGLTLWLTKDKYRADRAAKNYVFQKIMEDFCFSFARPLVSSYGKWDKMHPHYLCLCNTFSHCSEPAGEIWNPLIFLSALQQGALCLFPVVHWNTCGSPGCQSSPSLDNPQSKDLEIWFWYGIIKLYFNEFVAVIVSVIVIITLRDRKVSFLELLLELKIAVEK